MSVDGRPARALGIDAEGRLVLDSGAVETGEITLVGIDLRPMYYTFIGTASSPNHQAFADELRAALERTGFERAADGDSDVDLVINVADYETARPFRRKSKGTYVAALHELVETPETLEDGLAASYPMLVRALANIVLALTPGPAVRFTTMERGNYVVEAPDSPSWPTASSSA